MLLVVPLGRGGFLASHMGQVLSKVWWSPVVLQREQVRTV